jgi:L-glyceraldehyde 3-phosphate reductase
MGALDTAVRQGKALYVGISSYSAEKTREAARSCSELGTPLLIHQRRTRCCKPWIEPELLDTLGELGVGCIGFSPLAQGMLTDKYPRTDPGGLARDAAQLALARPAHRRGVAKIRALNEIAGARGQTLAQMALAWTLRDPRVTSTLDRRVSVEQLEDNVGALDNLDSRDDELAEIDRYATESGPQPCGRARASRARHLVLTETERPPLSRPERGRGGIRHSGTFDVAQRSYRARGGPASSSQLACSSERLEL